LLGNKDVIYILLRVICTIYNDISKKHYSAQHMEMILSWYYRDDILVFDQSYCVYIHMILFKFLMTLINYYSIIINIIIIEQYKYYWIIIKVIKNLKSIMWM